MFQSSSAKRAKPGENNKAQTELSTFHDLYETLMTAGNHDVIANGAFEYTPHRMLHDSSMYVLAIDMRYQNLFIFRIGSTPLN